MTRRLLPAAMAELVATAGLVFFVIGALVLDQHLGPDGYGLLGVGLVAGAAYAAAVLACRQAGGGHANPAVSIAAYLTGRTGATRAGVYVLAQLAGGVLGAAFARSLLPLAAVEAVQHGVVQASGTAPLTAVTLELVVTFFLALALFAALLDGSPAAGAIAVGAAAMAGTVLAHPITGAAMNPARALGPAVLEGVWRGQWIYLVGPVLGATLAGAVHDGLIRETDEASAESEA